MIPNEINLIKIEFEFCCFFQLTKVSLAYDCGHKSKFDAKLST